MDTCLSDILSIPLDEEGLGYLQETIQALQLALRKVECLKEYVRNKTPSEDPIHDEKKSKRHQQMNEEGVLNASQRLNLEPSGLNQVKDLNHNLSPTLECSHSNLMQNSPQFPEYSNSPLLQMVVPVVDYPPTVSSDNTLVSNLPLQTNDQVQTVVAADVSHSEYPVDVPNLDCITSESEQPCIDLTSCDSESEGNKPPIVDLTSCDSETEDQQKVFFTIKINRIDEKDISQVLVKEGFLNAKVKVDNLMKRSIGVIRFLQEADVDRALKLSSKLYIYKQPLVIRPYKKNNKQKMNLLKTNEISKKTDESNDTGVQLNNSFKEIEEHLLINASCGYHMNRQLEAVPETFCEKKNDSENCLQNKTNGFFFQSTSNEKESQELNKGSQLSKDDKPHKLSFLNPSTSHTEPFVSRYCNGMTTNSPGNSNMSSTGKNAESAIFRSFSFTEPSVFPRECYTDGNNISIFPSSLAKKQATNGTEFATNSECSFSVSSEDKLKSPTFIKVNQPADAGEFALRTQCRHPFNVTPSWQRCHSDRHQGIKRRAHSSYGHNFKRARQQPFSQKKSYHNKILKELRRNYNNYPLWNG